MGLQGGKAARRHPALLHFSMLRSPAFRLLPERALVKKKGQKVAKKAYVAPEYKLVPYIPPELTRVTQDFFKNQARLKGLLELTFSPLEPADEPEDRREYEDAFNAVTEVRERAAAVFK